jgi:hypothetical protein
MEGNSAILSHCDLTMALNRASIASMAIAQSDVTNEMAVNTNKPMEGVERASLEGAQYDAPTAAPSATSSTDARRKAFGRGIRMAMYSRRVASNVMMGRKEGIGPTDMKASMALTPVKNTVGC